ncbi:MAG: DUF1552 domain-containing protein [Acidimicrobiia bacterium]|nr:DUF1552 domain-containing protein [Acidimicrobiia bacterium]
MIVTKKALPRRTFLRGMGTALALPLLDGMVPAFAAPRSSAAKPIARLGIVYVPNGIWMQNWTPKQEDLSVGLPAALEPFAGYRDRLLVVTGLSNKQADALPGEGAGDHARASGAYLTGVHPKKTEGTDLGAGVSIDQIAARTLGQDTQFASLELSLDSREAIGSCDPGYSCAYANTLCWRTPTTPLPMENDPRVVFERMFGGTASTDKTASAARRAEQRSILDAVNQRLSRLKADLGVQDSRKLDEYSEAIRDVERRIQRAEEQSDRELPIVDQPAGIPRQFEDHAKLMFDLQVLAYQADLTRVITFMVANETSQRAYPEIGVPDAHHALSHHGNDKSKIAKLQKVNIFHSTLFAHYLNRLATTPDGPGKLLDHLTLLYGSGMSDGNTHNHHDLPTILLSRQWRSGRQITVPMYTPVTNLFLTMLDSLGVPIESFGDSTGQLTPLTV